MRRPNSLIFMCLAFAMTPFLQSQEIPAQSASPGIAQRRDITPVGSHGRNRLERTNALNSASGQVWREYDIRSFTKRLRDQEHPEQAVVDWIIRETGTQTWFGEPMGVLSANADVVRVYHVPEVQATVKNVIDRFLNTRSEANEVAVRLVTVTDPDWRIKALPVMESISTQNPSIEAWVVSRENAAMLLYELEKRIDFQEHGSRNLTIYSGQTHTIKNTRPRTFTKPGPVNGYAGTNVRTINEGFTLQINPLLSQDRRSMDAVIKCGVEQVEGFTPLWLDGSDQFGARQRSQIQIPRISSWSLHERFRWPTDEVLVVSRGMVPTPGPTGGWARSIRKLVDNRAPRAEALLFLESRSQIQSASASRRMATRTDAANYRGRY